MGNSNSRSRTQRLHGKATVQTFLQSHQGRSVVVFTDGSVINGPYGAGACASLLLPLKDEDLITQSIAVGSHVENVECELTGIILAMEMILQYFVKMGPERKLNERVYILCDCESAIKIIVNRNEERYHSEKFKLLDDTYRTLQSMHVSVSIGWIPGHSDIFYNDLVDKEARLRAQSVQDGTTDADAALSIPAAIKLSKDLVGTCVKWEEQQKC